MSSSAVSPLHFHRRVARCHSRRPRSVASSLPVIGSSIRTTPGTVHTTHHRGICPSWRRLSESHQLPQVWSVTLSRQTGAPHFRVRVAAPRAMDTSWSPRYSPKANEALKTDNSASKRPAQRMPFGLIGYSFSEVSHSFSLRCGAPNDDDSRIRT